MDPKKCRVFGLLLAGAGILLRKAGFLLGKALMIRLGAGAVLAGAAFLLLFHHCPHCGRFMFRNWGEICPHCKEHTE